MSILPVITAPDSILKQKSLQVEVFTKETQKFMDDLLETMYYKEGAGLAAVQVGVLQRILVIDISDYDDEPRAEGFYPLFMVNPEIISKSEKQVIASEGCLSLPEQRTEVARSESIRVRYYDYDNNFKELEVGDWLSRVIQHEYDHLEGKLMIDYLSSLKRDVALRKLRKLKSHIV